MTTEQLKRLAPKIKCTYCNLLILGDDVVAWWGDQPFHRAHTPDKTVKLSENKKLYTIVTRRIPPWEKEDC